MSEGDFLSRWSRRKRAARSGRAEAEPAATPAQAAASSVPQVAAASLPAVEPPAPAPLPPVESLTFDSDFTAFMRPEVDGALRREALKTLLHDPRFNVMDGLDVYIDDYSKPDPLPEGWLEKMNQVAHLGHYQPPPDAVEAAEGAASATSEASAAIASPESPADTPSEPAPAQDSGKPESEPHSRS